VSNQEPEKLFTIAKQSGDFSAVDALIRRVVRGVAGYASTPEGRADADHRARLYLERKKRELLDLADARGVPVDLAVREHASDAQLDWSSVAALRVVLADRKLRQGARTIGKAPAVAVLGGPKGTGKTTALAWAITHAPLTAQYATAAEIAETKRWGDGAAAWARWERVDTLAIDELGVESDPEAVSKLLLHRWDRAGGLTVCAGNLTFEDTCARYLSQGVGDRVLDRLSLQRCDWWHEITGPSRTERALKGGAK